MENKRSAPSAREITRLRVPRAPPVAIDSGHHQRDFLRSRDALVEEHLFLVPPIATRLASFLPVDVDDLIAIGNLALIQSATRFDPHHPRQAAFATFARPRIRGAMIDSCRRSRFKDATMCRLEDHDEPWAEATIETHIDEGRLRRRLKAAVADLTARQQRVVASYYGQQLMKDLATPGGHRLDHLAVVGSALSDKGRLPEWNRITEHAAAIEDLRHRLKDAA